MSNTKNMLNSHQVVTLGTFGTIDIQKIIDADGNEWITRAQVAEALDYTNESKVRKIHRVLENEGVLKLVQNGLPSSEPMYTRLPMPSGQKAVVYNSAAIIEICLESSKPKAKELRRWMSKQHKVTSTGTGELVVSNKNEPNEYDVIMQSHPAMAAWFELAKEGMRRDQELKRLSNEQEAIARGQKDLETKLLKMVTYGSESLNVAKVARRLGWYTKDDKLATRAVTKAIQAQDLLSKGEASRAVDYSGFPAWYVTEEGVKTLESAYTEAPGVFFDVWFSGHRNIVVKKR